MVLFLMGSGGDGVITAGDLLARTAARFGLECHLTKSFGPQIRGGESGVWVQIASREIQGPPSAVDLLLAFSWSSYPQFATQIRLAPGATVLEDESEAGSMPEGLLDAAGRSPVPTSVPLRRLADALGASRSRNLVATGLLCELLGLPPTVIRETLEKKFAKHGESVVAGAVEAFEAGREISGDPPAADIADRFSGLSSKEGPPRFLATGNDAVVLGALFAGVEFFAGYPITPASEILTGLSAQLPATGGGVIQAEDEIASACMVIGASFGGKKAMTATSGPGLSLMVEAIGLACQLELPCVIVDVQRGGPSTGMPTRTEQSDLQLAVYGAHGDAPRVVLAATDVASCFGATVQAFYIAETYQTPVIVLTDQLIAHREEALPHDVFDADHGFRRVARRLTAPAAPDRPYQRFAIDDHPVSPMAIPGTEGCCYSTSGIVHNEDGTPTASAEVHERMNRKVRRKLDLLSSEIPGYRVTGPPDATHGIITWGSSAGSALDAAQRLGAQGRPTAVMAVEILSPLPAAAIRDFVDRMEEVTVLELSFSGQFGRLLRGEGVDLTRARHVHRGGGDPFTGHEVWKELTKSAGDVPTQQVEA